GELRYPVSLMAGRMPVLVAPHTLGLDEADAHFAVQGGGSRRKAPVQAMQELLNASPDHLWGIVSNGKQLRLLRDAASLTRPRFLEVDLADLLAVSATPNSPTSGACCMPVVRPVIVYKELKPASGNDGA